MTAPLAAHARHVVRAFGTVLLFAWLLFAIVVVVLRYVVLPNVDHYRGELERAASRASGESVTIGRIETSWRGLLPAIVVHDVRVVDAAGTQAFALPMLRATLSWESLAVLQLRLARLEAYAPRVVVRRDASGQLFVGGYPIRKRNTPDSKLAEWLLAQGEVRVSGGRVTWHDEMGDGDGAPAVARPDLAISDVAFALVRSGRTHRVALHAAPPSELAAPIDLRARIDHPLFDARPADPDDWSGELYADVATGDVAAWRRWLPLPATVDAGRGRVRLWISFDAADAPAGVFAQRLAERIKRPIPAELDRIADVTADLALDGVAAQWGAMADAPEYASIGSIDGRVVASQSMTEQHLAALHMALEPAHGARVPPTDFTMQRRIGAAVDDESGTASLGAIDIGVSLGLVPVALIPPPIAEKLAALKPRGDLVKVDAQWTGPIAAPATFRADARFAGLAVAPQAPTPGAIAAAAQAIVAPNGLVRRPRKAFGQPGFDHLGGTLTATRSRGADGAPARTEVTLAFEGDDATLIAPGLFDDPTIRLAHLAANVDLRLVGDDIEVKVDHASLDNADLAGTVAMTFRHGPKSGGVGDNGGRGWIDLDARVSRADVARVPRYLPNILSERARLYLGRALISGRSEGSLRMRGPLDRLNLRVMPGALAVPNPIDVNSALVAVRDGAARPGPAAAMPAGAPSSGASDDANDATPDDKSTEPIFHALIRVHGATFLYAPGRRPGDPPPLSGNTPSATSSIPWPAFEDLDADIVFDQTTMTVRARSARVYDYRLTDITAVLPALADPHHVLRVSGKGSGALQDLIRFMNNSPISRWLRHFTDNTKATGNAALALAFDLPLFNPRNTDLAGSLRFSSNDLALNAIAPPLLNIDGRMDFSDRGLTIDGMTATALGGPLRVDASTGKDGYIALNASGMIDVAALQKSSHEAGTDGVGTPVASVVDRAATFLSGSTHYTVALRVRSKRVTDLSDSADVKAPAPNGPSQPDLVVQSDLVGLAIALPAPLSKPADARWPLRIELARTITNGAPTPDREDVHVTLADRVDVRVVRQPNAEGQLAVARAGYLVGDGSATTSGPTDITIRLPFVDVDAWRAALKAASAPKATSAPPANATVDALLPARATLQTPSLRAYGREFTNVAVTAERTPAGWKANVESDQVAGDLSYSDVSGHADTRNGVAPASSAKFVAHLSKLIIPASDVPSQQIERALDANQQRGIPAIDVVVDRFELRGRTLGRLAVVGENVDVGSTREWRLEKLDLTTPEARFAASGTWGHDGGAASGDVDHTRLDFNLRTSDVGALMDRFGLVRTIKNGTATLTGNVAWNGGPSTIDFESLSGRMQLAADKGQFLKAEPGISKLLNILSLQGLARRLKLDFTDVFAAGFAFDTVRADATIDHGIASTEDFTMRGVEAVVLMSGNANLARETTSLHVIVEPQINAGAASLGLAIVNPVIGLATFVAQYLFKDQITRALTFEYNVVGPWKKPEVTRISHNGKETRVVPRVAPGAPVASDR